MSGLGGMAGPMGHVALASAAFDMYSEDPLLRTIIIIPTCRVDFSGCQQKLGHHFVSPDLSLSRRDKRTSLKYQDRL